MKRVLFLLALVIAMIAAIVPAFAAGPSDESVSQAPRIESRRNSDPTTSLNWAGYAAETNFSRPSNGVVNDVSAQWAVPTVIASTGNTYSSIWVGIDGFSDNTVEQIGTEQDWINGQPSYYAWWETYPKNATQPISGLTISPGDIITVEVKYVGGGQFRMSLGDVNTGKSFSTTQTLRSAKRQSAEWIVEAPFAGGILPLADFQSMTFTNASATFNNTSGSITNSNWQNQSITMVTQNGTVKAQPYGLTPDGTSFSVDWNHN